MKTEYAMILTDITRILTSNVKTSHLSHTYILIIHLQHIELKPPSRQQNKIQKQPLANIIDQGFSSNEKVKAT